MLLDFSDRTRTGISKLISRCALGIGFMEYQFRMADQFHILVDEGVFIWISSLSTFMEVSLSGYPGYQIIHIYEDDPSWTLSLSILDIQDDSNLGHPWSIL